VDHPTYEQVSSGQTGHAEAVEITFDPAKTSYEQLLEVFWHNIDPTALNRQFADAGTQYRTAIFYHSDAQKQAAEASKAKLTQSGKFKRALVTGIVPATKFWPAEDYHQAYYRKNAGHYKMYRLGSGREGYLKETWGAEGK
jgi:methionine-S-sulfoxide reductase